MKTENMNLSVDENRHHEFECRGIWREGVRKFINIISVVQIKIRHSKPS